MRRKANVALVLALVGLTALAISGLPAQQDPPQPPAADQGGSNKAPVKQIKMYAENWKWSPSMIRVDQGTRLQIHFESRDASHAFVLKGYDINIALPQDTTADVEFVADRAGEFKYVCGRPCGNGCPKMKGKLIVDPVGE